MTKGRCPLRLAVWFKSQTYCMDLIMTFVKTSRVCGLSFVDCLVILKGDDNDEQDDNDEKEELDREMGDDVGDNADVVDEKLWEEEEDDDGMEEGKEEQEEKFEAG